MSRSIQQLADEVLREATASVKTASVESPEDTSHKTEIGRSLKQAADLIRNLDDVTPSNLDLQQIRVAQNKVATDQTIKNLPEHGSALGNTLRKIANDLRATGSKNEELRARKTAQIINAAVALQHLGTK